LIDMATEREKVFYETLQRILDSRVRLEKQQKDFDQLSLDLQMRLDAKEFTACEIAESFRAFKKEILEKAEDSRTGQVRGRESVCIRDTVCERQRLRELRNSRPASLPLLLLLTIFCLYLTVTTAPFIPCPSPPSTPFAFHESF
jgi:hypothetical protein